MFHAITQVPQKQVLPSWKCTTISLEFIDNLGHLEKNILQFRIMSVVYVLFAEMHCVFNVIDQAEIPEIHILDSGRMR